MSRPLTGDYSAFQQTYIDKVSGDDVLEVLQQSFLTNQQFLDSLPENKASHSYAPGKWTVVQVLQHMVDTERVLAYRAMCIARGEMQDLPGFDEDEFAANADASHRNWNDLLEELMLMRNATIILFQSLKPEDIEKSGNANGKRITVNALGFIIAGHFYHHQQILQERYLA